MAYVGRHRRYTRRSAPRRSSGRIVRVAGNFGQSLTNAANPVTILPLAELETRIGNEIWGATVLQVKGELLAWGPSATATAAGWMYWGSMVVRNSGDLTAGHPAPTFASANADKYSDWYGMAYVPTPITNGGTGIVSQSPLRRLVRWVNPRRGRISQPEDDFHFVWQYDQGVAASTMTFNANWEIWVRLP